MTTKLEEMLSNLNAMSEEDLETLQKGIAEKLEKKPPKVDLLKIGYRLTPQEIEAQLLEFLTPEELAEALEDGNDEPLNLPKSLSEYIIEDREDRL